VIAKSNFRKGGANLLVCRGARQGVAHLFGNYGPVAQISAAMFGEGEAPDEPCFARDF